MKNNKICWACKRVLIGKSKLGLCPNCVNKYGTPAAAIGVLVVASGIKAASKLIKK